MYFFQCEKTIKDFSEKFHNELKNTKIKRPPDVADETLTWVNAFTLGIPKLVTVGNRFSFWFYSKKKYIIQEIKYEILMIYKFT